MLHIPGMLDEMRRPMMLIVSARNVPDRDVRGLRFKTEIRSISMKSLVIAEKPSVARDIARVLKGTGKNINGAIEGGSLRGNLGAGPSGDPG